MIIELPRASRFIARHFAGTRKFFAEKYMSDSVSACRFEHITYPFDAGVMDGKRLIALATGAIEPEEIALAKKYLTTHDVVVELCLIGNHAEYGGVSFVTLDLLLADMRIGVT